MCGPIGVGRRHRAHARASSKPRSRHATAGQPTPAPTPDPEAIDVLGYLPIAHELDAGKLDLIWAVAEAYADDRRTRVVGAETSYGGAARCSTSMACATTCVEHMRRARTDVTLVSPYVIPGRKGWRPCARCASAASASRW